MRYYSKFRVKLIMTILLLVIIPVVVIATILFARSVDIIEEKSFITVQNNLELIINEISESFLESYDLALQIATDLEVIETLSEMDSLDDLEQQEKAIELHNKLREIKTLNQYIESIYIYNYPSHSIVSTKPAQEFHVLSEQENRDWIERNRIKGVEGLLNIIDFKDTLYTQEKVLISVSQEINSNDSIAPLGHIYINLDERKFYFNIISPSNQYESGKFYLINSDGLILSSEYLDEIYTSAAKVTNLTKLENKSSGYFITTENGQQIYNVFVTERYNRYKLLYKLPLNALIGEIVVLRNFVGYLSLFLIGVSILIGFGFSWAISKPIVDLKEAMGAFGGGNFLVRLPESRKDEFGTLNKGFNEMTKQLKEFNDELENRVEQRTLELSQKNEELNVVLNSLEETRDELIHTAKMNLTSQLVAGIAHEINTPLGVALTACSYLNQEASDLNARYITGRVTRKMFEKYMYNIIDSTDSIQKNLDRSANLVNTFKQLAQDQFSQEKRFFNLRDYFDSLMISYRKELEVKEHSIELNCSSDISMYGYPSAFFQIFSNLLSNSIDHGFIEKHGKIKIDVQIKEHVIEIIYSDNGIGIDKEMLNQIYEPFFSSKHNSGWSGLGLSIVWNAVTNTLKGTIECESEYGEGTVFRIEIPHEGGLEDVSL